MDIDFLAQEGHFLAHLAPIWHALPEEARGEFYVEPRLIVPAERAGLRTRTLPMRRRPQNLVVAASYRDFKYARDRGRPVVLSEHGAGQSYIDSRTGQPIRSGSYIGAPDREGVVAVLVPGPMQAERHSAAHPTIPAFAVGVPKLDPHHRAMRDGSRVRPRSQGPVVAISFHWPCTVAPEARGAYSHYRWALKPLAEKFDVLGHGHPRGMDRLASYYRSAGIEVVREFEQVIERADVYVCDNSSTMYEWASLDRPVVVLNSPRYRRNVEHGLRFWEYADLGPQVDKPEQLIGAVQRAAQDPPVLAERRREIVGAVYAACDGHAAERAAAAVLETLKTLGGASGSDHSGPTQPALHDHQALGV